jgi:hypothetical protein
VAGVPLHQRESLYTTQHVPGTPRGATPGGETAGSQPGGSSSEQPQPSLSLARRLLALLGGSTAASGSGRGHGKLSRGSAPGNSPSGPGRSQRLSAGGTVATGQFAYLPPDANTLAGDDDQLVTAYFETIAEWLAGPLP